MYITLEEAKTHLNIESGYTADDIYIEDIIDVAEQVVTDYLNGVILTGETTTTVNKSIKHATLLFIGHLYATRTVVSYAEGKEIPMAFKFLLNPYKDYSIA